MGSKVTGKITDCSTRISFMVQSDPCSWLKVAGVIEHRRHRVYGKRRDRRFTRHLILHWSAFFCVSLHTSHSAKTHSISCLHARHLSIKLSTSENKSINSSKMWSPIFKVLAVNAGLVNRPTESSSFSGSLMAVSRCMAEIWPHIL